MIWTFQCYHSMQSKQWIAAMRTLLITAGKCLFGKMKLHKSTFIILLTLIINLIVLVSFILMWGTMMLTTIMKNPLQDAQSNFGVKISINLKSKFTAIYCDTLRKKIFCYGIFSELSTSSTSSWNYFRGIFFNWIPKLYLQEVCNNLSDIISKI